MKNIIFSFLLLISSSPALFARVAGIQNEPDSAYIFSYATNRNQNHDGLHFAWSLDETTWFPIGPEYSYMKSDFGSWGSQKRMLYPVIFQDRAGLWHCFFSVNEKDGVLAHATSGDLIKWRPQSYHYMMEAGNCMNIEVNYDKQTSVYLISWVSTEGKERGVYGITTRDFKTYTPVKKVTKAERTNSRKAVNISGSQQMGIAQKVSWNVIDELIKTSQLADYKRILHSETTANDPVRFAGLNSVEAQLTLYPEESKPISDMLIGIFFEDINYAADGGIYAELIQNRGFEYDLSDKQGRDESWTHLKAWSVSGKGATLTIDTIFPIHPNNPHYANLQIITPGAGLVNEGFDGIPLKAGEKYNYSVFARTPEAKRGKLKIRLIGKDGEVYGEATTSTITGQWKKYEGVLTPSQTVSDAGLEVIPQMSGSVQLDMISLFPQKTFKGRKNGLRADLAQTLADMKPRFVRFPGGCVAHGNGLDNMYRWKNTLGPLESRKPQRNLWNYHQTTGLGYYEYFLFCEDIGAEPLPVLPAGVPCQNSSIGGHGQQCGIPLENMQEYIQEVFDLIEWANGDAKTTVWGKKRAEAGHPKPFNLKYIGIGNEDLISDVFEERYVMICNAVREKYPDIIVIGTVGPFCEGSDYEEGWRIATEIDLPMVDEHYYNPPGWYIHNQDYYDRYDRSKSKVYLGEYAAHLPGRPNNIETALAEALHLANIERNGDVVSLTSYAPLLAKEGFTQWNPDLIYFNNTEVKPTVGYYVQQLYGLNSGDTYLPGQVQLSNNDEAVRKRVTTSVVYDSKSGDYILKFINILPVPVQMNVDLKPLQIARSAGILTILKGRPDDKT
ncbi:MAG: carbohydrate binding domain-containing protein, partial [Bacteroides sp.]|nr:carbohydrate binding domain-containing protein [Bacteroides sp.]